MSVPRFSTVRTTGLSGFVLLVFSLAACSSGGDAVVLGAADPGSIEVGSEFVSVFGPTDLGEIEITAESIAMEPGVESDRFASYVPEPERAMPVVTQAVVAKARDKKPESTWLASMEKSVASASANVAAAVAPTPDAVGALGGGAGVEGTGFDGGFKPVRKSFASRSGSTSDTGVASIVDTGRSASKSEASSASRKPVAREQKALEAKDIKRIVQRQQARVRACYERALKGETHLEGKLMMAWNVERDGSVSAVSVADDQLGNEQVARCVTHAVSKFRFPAGPDLVQVEYPMVFAPGDGY